MKYPALINDRPHITIFIGRKGSGKTALLLRLLKCQDGYKKIYQDITIVSPTFKLQECWKSLSAEGITVYEALTDELLEKLHNSQSPMTSSLIIFDDNGDQLRRCNPAILNKLVSNSRHLNCSMIFLQQKLTQLPTVIRAQFDVGLFFSACSYRETEALWAEIGILEKKRFFEIFRDATREQYGFFCVSMLNGKLRFFKNLTHEYNK